MSKEMKWHPMLRAHPGTAPTPVPQPSSAASGRGVRAPAIGTGGETPPKLAGGHACDTGGSVAMRSDATAEGKVLFARFRSYVRGLLTRVDVEPMDAAIPDHGRHDRVMNAMIGSEYFGLRFRLTEIAFDQGRNPTIESVFENPGDPAV